MQELTQRNRFWRDAVRTCILDGSMYANAHKRWRTLDFICSCCGTTVSVSTIQKDDVTFCAECDDRATEQAGRDYDSIELGGEA